MKPLKQVRSYETSDGILHHCPATAIRHQVQIDLRGMIQSRGIVGAIQPNFTPAQVAEFIVAKSEDIRSLLSEMHTKTQRAEKKTLLTAGR